MLVRAGTASLAGLSSSSSSHPRCKPGWLRILRGPQHSSQPALPYSVTLFAVDASWQPRKTVTPPLPFVTPQTTGLVASGPADGALEGEDVGGGNRPKGGEPARGEASVRKLLAAKPGPVQPG